MNTKTKKPTPTTPLLTEEEVLKMSEDDYMNPAQLAFFKDRLQKLEQDLIKNAGQTTENLRETTLVPDPADRATIEEEHALELRTRDRERKLLKKVQQSIASIDTGDYGWCVETGEPIGVARLMARPTATLSLEAQQRRELNRNCTATEVNRTSIKKAGISPAFFIGFQTRLATNDKGFRSHAFHFFHSLRRICQTWIRASQ